MLSIVICLVIMIFKAEAMDPATDNPVIRLKSEHDGNENYTVLKDKPLNIALEYHWARYFWCYNMIKNSMNGDKDCQKFVPEVEFKDNLINHIIHVPNVTAEMSTRWTCTVQEEYHGPSREERNNRNYTVTSTHFQLHVKGAKSVMLTANNHNLTCVITNLTVDYDGDAHYTFKDGEDLDFSCTRPQDDSFGVLRLEYFNAEGILLFQTESRQTKPHIFRSVLKSKNNKYYLDCIYTTTSPKREYRYRTTFYMNKQDADAVQNAITLSINGQQLLPIFSNGVEPYDDYRFYRYRYIDGEILNVTCQKIGNIIGTLQFYYDSKDTNYNGKVLRTPSMGEYMISLNTAKSDLNNKTLICINNAKDVLKLQAKLLFLSDLSEIDVRILGLSKKNVLYQYTNGLHHWTIEYEYSVNDTLDLTCVTKGFLASNHRFQWKFQGETIDSETNISSNTIMFSTKKFTKILDITDDGSKILCKQFSYPNDIYTEVILRLKPDIVSEVDSVKIIPGHEDNRKYMLVIISVSVVVLIAIITMISIVYWRRRTMLLANLTQNAYDNLSNQDDSPIPAFPSQWESNYDDSHYTKIDEGVMQENYSYATNYDKSYNKSYKRQSNTSENHYTEIDEYFKPIYDGLEVNLNNAKPTNCIKGKYTYNASNNKFDDSRQNNYDRLRYSNVPISNDLNSHNGSGYVQRITKNKTVTFRQGNDDLRLHGEGNSRQDFKKNDRGLKRNSEGVKTDTDIYMTPGIMPKKPNYENNFIKNEETNNSVDVDYAEPYGELEVNCKNDCYGYTPPPSSGGT